MNISKYRNAKAKEAKMVPYSLSLPAPIVKALEQLRCEKDFPVRGWARDVLLDHLPELLKALHVETRS